MALFDAIEAGNAAEARSLLAEDPSLAGSRSPSGVSALLWARYRNHGEIVDALLAADPVLDVFDAAALGRVERLAELVDANPSQANAWSADGFTPVGLAAFFGHPEAVRYLIGKGADVRAVARNPMLVQPLHAATAARSVESVRLLLEAGADPDAEQQEGWTALMAARAHGDEEIIALLLAHGAHDPDAAPPAVETPEPPQDQAGGPSGNRSRTS
jgi:ankyrin repeat protein